MSISVAKKCHSTTRRRTARQRRTFYRLVTCLGVKDLHELMYEYWFDPWPIPQEEFDKAIDRCLRLGDWKEYLAEFLYCFVNAEQRKLFAGPEVAFLSSIATKWLREHMY